MSKCDAVRHVMCKNTIILDILHRSVTKSVCRRLSVTLL